jgi:hypothetical protein
MGGSRGGAIEMADGKYKAELREREAGVSEMTVTEFCDKHDACAEGRKWAVSTGCATMAEIWLRDDLRHSWLEWIATRPGVLPDRELRLYACWCVRQVWNLLTDERSRTAVEVAERYADGLATDAELGAAQAAAGDAARDAARDAAWDSARYAAWDAAWAAARAAAGEAARAAAGEAAWEAAEARAARAAAEAEARAARAARAAAEAAAWAEARAARAAAWEAAEAAAGAAAREAARAAQSKWLVENANPNFEKGGGGERVRSAS